jgi:TP901 family phage tail tape measure protein
MPDYAVAMKFTAKDHITKTYQRMGEAADAFNRKASAGARNTASSFRNATKEGYKFGTVVKGILAASAIRGGLGMITNGVRGAATGFLDFDDAMVGAFARFDDLGPRSKNIQTELMNLKQGTLDAIRGTEHSAVSAGSAMDFFAKANWSSKSALDALRPMLNLSTASGEEFSATVDMTNDLLGAFNMRSEDSGKQLAYLSRMTDVLTRSGLDANGGLVDFFETMKGVGPIARSVGASLEDVGAMQVLLANAGIKGTNAETALKRALINIPSDRLKKKFEGVGIAIEDSAGNVRSYIDIFADLNKFMGSMGNRTKINIAEDIFGMYGVAGGINVLSGLDKVVKERDRLMSSKGITEEISEFRRQYSTQIKLTILQNALLEKSFSVFENFKYQGMTGLDGLVKAINDWDPKELIGGLQATVNILSVMWRIIEPFAPYLHLIAQGFLGWKMVMAGFSVINFVSGLGMMNGGLAMMNLQLTGAVAAFGAIAAGMLAVFAIWEAGKSAFTGKDNFFSQVAQDIGLVPKLSHDANGRVTGFAGDGQSLATSVPSVMSGLGGLRFPGPEMFNMAPAPNSKEAEARRIQFEAQISLANAPPGTTVSSHTRGAPNIPMQLLGAAQ